MISNVGPMFLAPSRAPEVNACSKKLSERLSESLVYEYSLGYKPTAEGGDEHVGMKLLEQLRLLQRKMTAAKAFVEAIHAENGPSSPPKCIVDAAGALSDLSIAVPPAAHLHAVRKSTDRARKNRDWNLFWQLLTGDVTAEETSTVVVALKHVTLSKDNDEDKRKRGSSRCPLSSRRSST